MNIIYICDCVHRLWLFNSAESLLRCILQHLVTVCRRTCWSWLETSQSGIKVRLCLSLVYLKQEKLLRRQLISESVWTVMYSQGAPITCPSCCGSWIPFLSRLPSASWDPRPAWWYGRVNTWTRRAEYTCRACTPGTMWENLKPFLTEIIYSICKIV